MSTRRAGDHASGALKEGTLELPPERETAFSHAGTLEEGYGSLGSKMQQNGRLFLNKSGFK